MKSRRSCFQVLLAVCVCFAPNSMGQWTEVADLPGGTIQDYCSIDSIHFLAMDGRIFHSADDGASWTSMSTPGNRKVYSVEALDGTLLVGTPDGVFQSSMVKIGWEPFHRTGLSEFPVLSIWTYLGYLYIGTIGAVYKSIDQGKTWSESKSGLPGDARMSRFAGIVKIAVAGSENRGVFITESMNWIPSAGISSENNRFHDLEVFGNKVYAVTAHEVLESANLGADWVPSSIALGQITSLLGDGGYLYAGTDRGIYLSVDKGGTWEPSSQGIPENTSIRSLEKIGRNIYASTDTDAWRFTSTSAGLHGLPPGATLRPHRLLELHGNRILVGISLPLANLVDITALDFLGRAVWSRYRLRVEQGRRTLSLDTGPIAPGDYLIRINTREGKVLQAFSFGY